MELAELYKAALSEREHDSSRFWTIFSVLSVINAGLFALLTSDQPARAVAMFVSILGVALCCVWYGVQSRMAAWIRWWERRLQLLEAPYFGYLRQQNTSPLPAEFRLFEARALDTKDGISTKTAAQALPIMFGIGWLVVLALTIAGDTPRPQNKCCCECQSINQGASPIEHQ